MSASLACAVPDIKPKVPATWNDAEWLGDSGKLIQKSGKTPRRAQVRSRSNALNRLELLKKLAETRIIRTSAAANMDFGHRGTYQITVGIECVQKRSQLIGAGIWLNSFQCVFFYEEWRLLTY
jgi:hypothetical protein